MFKLRGFLVFRNFFVGFFSCCINRFCVGVLLGFFVVFIG